MKQPSPLDIVKVQSHVEKRKKDPKTRTCHEIGNYIADRVATIDPQVHATIQREYPQLILLQVASAIQIEQYAYQYIPYTIIQHHRPIAAKPKTIVRAYDWLQYSYQRDNIYHNDSGYWSEASLELASKCWSMTRCPSLQRIRIMRIVFDKLLHEGNAQRFEITSLPQTCLLCQGPSSEQHLFTECPHPNICNLRER
jgi:hypothetical protein